MRKVFAIVAPACAASLLTLSVSGCTPNTPVPTVGTLEELVVGSTDHAATAIGTAETTEMVAVFQEPAGPALGRVEAGTVLAVLDATDGWFQIQVDGETQAWVAENFVVFTPGKGNTE